MFLKWEYMENQDLQKDELEKIEGIGIYLESSRDWIINSIYNFIQEKPKESIIVLYLCEMEDFKLALYRRALEMLKDEKIIKDYKIKQDCVTIPEEKKQYTEADLMFDSDKYIEAQYEPDFLECPPEDFCPVSVVINKEDIDVMDIRKRATSKKFVELIELIDHQGEIIVFINNNYLNPIRLYQSKNDNSFWKKIFDLANKKIVEGDRSTVKYFNSNKYNPIYSRGFYKLTHILSLEKGQLINEIPIETITQEKINRVLGHKIKK